jgi:Methyltransferase domain
VSKITYAVKTAFNYCGLELARSRPALAKQKRLELDYDLRIAPRWGYGLEANKHIERAIAAHRALYARTLNGFLKYGRVIAAIPGDSADEDPVLPQWNNTFFSGLDAASLVCFVLEARPRVYFEIGSGNSTKFACHAIKSNGLRTKVISIDPQPRAEIDALCDEVCRMRLEDCDHHIFSVLQAGDILFFDGSHRIFTNSDVAIFFLEILPSLPPGVLVHIHDIFLPLDYPPEWNDRFYSEQYILAAMLLCRDRPFDIVLPNCYVTSDPTLFKSASMLMSGTGIDPAPAVSFWIQTKTS